MMNRSRYLACRQIIELARFVPQNLGQCTNQCVILNISRTMSLESQTLNSGRSNNIIPPNLSDTLRHNVNWFNGQYERIFGIDEIRQMQERVLQAESEFVSITKERKSCQDKIENFKEEVKNIRDKLDITPRQSDNYLKLITEEHKILREQLSHDARLCQLKEKEQWSLDNLSSLLRQSHELERLRQERAKYWQIISLGLSAVGGVVALFAQKVRNQKTTLKELASLNEGLQNLKDANELQFKELIGHINVLRSMTNHLTDQIQKQSALASAPARQALMGPDLHSNKTSWASWLLGISGIGYMRSRFVG